MNNVVDRGIPWCYEQIEFLKIWGLLDLVLQATDWLNEWRDVLTTNKTREIILHTFVSCSIEVHLDSTARVGFALAWESLCLIYGSVKRGNIRLREIIRLSSLPGGTVIPHSPLLNGFLPSTTTECPWAVVVAPVQPSNGKWSFYFLNTVLKITSTFEKGAKLPISSCG